MPQGMPRASRFASSESMPSNRVVSTATPASYRSRKAVCFSTQPSCSGSSPKPTRIMALAPLDTEGRICSAASGSRLWSWRSWFRQRMKSGAVSIRVPSRSNSTAEGFWSVFTNIPRVHQVVDVDITAQLVAFGDGVVGHTGKLAHVQPGVAQVVGHFRGPDELLPLVGALGQHVQHVFRAHNGKQEGLRVAVDGRHKQVAARAQHGRARLDDRARVRNVLQHFQAGDGVVLAGMFRVPGQLFDGGLAVVHLHTGFHAVQPSYVQRGFAHVDAGYVGTTQGHAFRQQTATTANIQYFLACQLYPLVDVVQAQGIDVVKRLELAAGVPPAAGQCFKLGNLVLVYVLVAHGVHLVEIIN